MSGQRKSWISLDDHLHPRISEGNQFWRRLPLMNDHLQEMAARTQAAGLSELFQVTKSVGLKQPVQSSATARAALQQLPKFLETCVTDAGAASAEAFVLGPHLGAISIKHPMLVPDADLAELKKWFGFYSRTFRLGQYTNEPHPQTNMEPKLAELITDVAEFVQWRLRAYGVWKPF